MREQRAACCAYARYPPAFAARILSHPSSLPFLLAEVQYALTAIPGIGRRISNVICKKAGIDLSKRAGELSADEIEKVVAILSNPQMFKIPEWMLNRQKDKVDGKSSMLVSNQVYVKLREDLENLKKVRAHRGLRHYWCLKVRGQHTCTTGRGRSFRVAADNAEKK